MTEGLYDPYISTLEEMRNNLIVAIVSFKEKNQKTREIKGKFNAWCTANNITPDQEQEIIEILFNEE